MSERDVIASRLRKKQAEIQSLEEKLRTAKVYVQALEDVMKALASSDHESLPETSLKPGSAVAQTRDVILARGKAVHISDLLIALGREGSRQQKASLVSSLAAYVRRGEIFTRPAPNTFGLVELAEQAGQASDILEPPPDFGRDRKPNDGDPFS